MFDLDEGTLLCANGSCLLYWSPHIWHSPKDGLEAQPADWHHVPDNIRQKLIERYGRDVIPGYPGEHVLLSEWPVVA